eukprot:scaffold175_cov414-Prasinococcus_capsulatus_cf.AAC.22
MSRGTRAVAGTLQTPHTGGQSLHRELLLHAVAQALGAAEPHKQASCSSSKRCPWGSLLAEERTAVICLCPAVGQRRF